MKNFKIVSSNLTRGAYPIPLEVRSLKNSGVDRIISLDERCGKNIERSCKLLDMDQIIIPLNAHDASSFKQVFKYNIPELFNKNTFVHCYRGKDRTGFLVALYRCLMEGWDCKKALKEARLYGFGTGMSAEAEKYATKIVQEQCQHDHQEDENKAYDIVSGARDYNSQYRDYAFDSYYQPGTADYADPGVRMYPYALVNKPFDEQYSSRETYPLEDEALDGIYRGENINRIPQVGVYDINTQSIGGYGPSMIGSGFV